MNLVRSSFPRRWFPVTFGTFLALTLLKFGNPPIMEKWVSPPEDLWQLVLWTPWPIVWAYGLLCVLVIMSFWCFRWRPTVSCWPILLLPVWLAWQFVATAFSIDLELSGPTLVHFVACGICFVFGFCCLEGEQDLKRLVVPLTIGFLLVLVIGFQQEFGGLEATRKYFYAEIYPKLKELPPGYLKKISSTRIFATLFYPNALAGLILLLLPVVLALTWQARSRFTIGARCFLLMAITLGSALCLAWSGSKGGWLLMLGAGGLSALHLNFDRRIKWALVFVALVFGLGAFAWRYHDFFRRGATSVVARFDYWDAALVTAGRHPLTGTGPGTFAKPYQSIKRPESEMARLVHNDYLEQASDSGWLGFLSYCGFLTGVLACTYRPALSRRPACPGDKAKTFEVDSSELLPFALWLGVLAWALQGLFEFGLYIPALAWPAFAFLGILAARAVPEAGLTRPTQKMRTSPSH